MPITAGPHVGRDFSKECIDNAELSRMRFDACDFRWADFTDVDTVYSCVFESCDFTNARLNGVTLRDCAFLSCKFKNTTLFATTFEDCKMTGSDFIGADCGLAQLRGGDWSYTVLRGQAFQKQDLRDIRFTGADLSECRFNACQMSGCEFNEATVFKTSFYKSDLRHASLASIALAETSFRQAKLDLEQCVLLAEQLTEGRYTPDEKK